MGDEGVDVGEESTAERVSRLLGESRAAHDRAKTARHQKRREDATAELTEARRLRLEAHAADPGHESAVWGTETPAHGLMMAFYAQQLGPVPDEAEG